MGGKHGVQQTTAKESKQGSVSIAKRSHSGWRDTKLGDTGHREGAGDPGASRKGLPIILKVSTFWVTSRELLPSYNVWLPEADERERWVTGRACGFQGPSPM